MPLVTALDSFDYFGRAVTKGDTPDFIEPVQALALARKGLVSLSRQSYKTRVLAPEPEPEPEPEQPTRRRRYRRRDMTADSE